VQADDRFGQPFVIFRQAPEAGRPGEGALDRPAPGHSDASTRGASDVAAGSADRRVRPSRYRSRTIDRNMRAYPGAIGSHKEGEPRRSRTPWRCSGAPPPQDRHHAKCVPRSPRRLWHPFRPGWPPFGRSLPDPPARANAPPASPARRRRVGPSCSPGPKTPGARRSCRPPPGSSRRRAGRAPSPRPAWSPAASRSRPDGCPGSDRR
jgi:hypothetical protein